MKSALNKNLGNYPVVNEQALFTEMAKQFNLSAVAAAYIIHQKVQVRYQSQYQWKGRNIKRVELGDLFFITYNQVRKELRLCTLQAKYVKDQTKPFKMDMFQWELLEQKPYVTPCTIPVPGNILNFNPAYESISAYGIFYNENNGNGNRNSTVDFLYTMPRCFFLKRTMYLPGRSSQKRFDFVCPNCNYHCLLCQGRDEAICTHLMDIFEKEVLDCNVGAVVLPKDLDWVLSLLNKMYSMDDVGGNDDALRIILDAYKDHPTSKEYEFDKLPSAMVIVTDGANHVKEHMKDKHDPS